MDIQAYISSGIIEAYVLGLASNEEVREVEMYAAQYTKVKQAITDFEIALEEQVIQTAVQPPAFLKEKVMAAIAAENIIATNITTPDAVKPAGTQAKVVPITAAPKSVRWLRGAVAASVILFLGSAILNFYYYSRYRESTAQLKKVEQENSALLAERGTLLAKSDVMEASLRTINDEAVVKIPMLAASPKHTGMLATVYWNKQSNDVFLMPNNLPKPEAGKQYQLWAIEVVDGNLKPTDAGMLPDSAQVIDLVRMKKMYKAQKFAITLEKEGGSPTPTLNELRVIGGI